MRENPERFATFVLGTFAFVYVVLLAIRAWRGWRPSAPAAAAALLAAVPVLAWAWRPSAFSRTAVHALEIWPARMLGLLALCAASAIGYLAALGLGGPSVRVSTRGALLLGLCGVFLMAPNLVFGAMLALGVAGRLLL
jgi:hypothetical protein